MVVALLLGGCAVGGGGGEIEALPDDLAAPARPLAAPAGGASTTATDGTGGAPGPAGGPGPGGRGGATTTTSASPRALPGNVEDSGGSGATAAKPAAVPYTARASVTDPPGDAGLRARPYGDLTMLRLEEDGTRARLTVQVAGDLPAPPAEGEVVGIGVDLFRGDDNESEYQLYALGNADGWRAWLHAPSGYVEYPGTFELGGDTIVFTVPWSALGGRRAGAISVYADRSQARVAVVADASEDRAPDRGAQSFAVPSSSAS